MTTYQQTRTTEDNQAQESAVKNMIYDMDCELEEEGELYKDALTDHYIRFPPE